MVLRSPVNASIATDDGIGEIAAGIIQTGSDGSSVRAVADRFEAGRGRRPRLQQHTQTYPTKVLDLYGTLEIIIFH